ncbi:MAG: hypothetical protein M1335_07035 [Chloroflexi bacterium]|nr:hypothetical protein [Chloroflexota bacterium]
MILHCYTPNIRENDQAHCWRALAQLSRYTVTHVEMTDVFSYSLAVQKAWDVDGDLLIVEQDMAPTVTMIDTLFDCREHACSQAYWLAPASSGALYPFYSGIGLSGHRIIFGEEWARSSGMGLIRLSREVRERMGRPDLCHFAQLDGQISVRLAGSGMHWHMHWPVCPHYHGFMEGENARIQEASRT